MPWEETGRVELRIEFVKEALSGSNISELCREFGITRRTGYKWINRFEETKQISSLIDQSRRPKDSPFRTSKEIERKVVALRNKYGWGADKLRVLLLNEKIDVPRVTINRIISRNGLLEAEDCHKPALKRFEKEKPNELWQVDLKGKMGKGSAHCEPLSIIDDHSRFVTGLHAVRSSKLEPIQQSFLKTFEKYGVPNALLMDHGVPWWGSSQVIGLTRLSVWLMNQEIKLYFSGYNHPQTQGKVERFHRTLAQAVRHKGTPKKFQLWSSLLNKIRNEYNFVRPHESLDMNVPASRYFASEKTFNPNPKPPDYPSGSTVIKLDSFGRFTYKSLRLFASEALANQCVRIEELENTALIFYRQTPLREFSLSSGSGTPFSLN